MISIYFMIYSVFLALHTDCSVLWCQRGIRQSRPTVEVCVPACWDTSSLSALFVFGLKLQQDLRPRLRMSLFSWVPREVLPHCTSPASEEPWEGGWEWWGHSSDVPAHPHITLSGPILTPNPWEATALKVKVKELRRTHEDSLIKVQQHLQVCSGNLNPSNAVFNSLLNNKYSFLFQCKPTFCISCGLNLILIHFYRWEFL